MSYIKAKGREARALSEENSKDYSKLLTKVPGSGQSPLVVKLLAVDDYVSYDAHSVYKTFYTTPCTKALGKDDLYDKAAELMFADVKAEFEAGKLTEDQAKERRKAAAQLLPKSKYLMGFLNLENGEPMIIEITDGQGNAVIDLIEKYAKHADKMAFELFKTGSSTKTVVNLAPVLDIDDLTKDQKKNFDAAVEKKTQFDEEAFGKLFRFKDEKEQAKDLVKFGFDVTRLGFNPAELESDDGAAGEGQTEQLTGDEKAEKLF